MKKNLLLLFALPLFIAAQSPVPSLLKDINTGPGATTFYAFSAFSNNNIVFGVSTPSSVTDGLWASDGSTAGTVQLKKLSSLIYDFVDYNGKKYLIGPTVGALWRTDGTLAGTDSLAIPEITAIHHARVCNNLLFFIATSTVTGTELWRTDGTPGGTFLARDIIPGLPSTFNSPNYSPAVANPLIGVFNNNVYFVANDNISGQEVWKSDGTTAGTNLLSDIYPGTGSSLPANFSVGNNGVYFTANTATYGTELWFTDGTMANTQMIKDVATGTASALPSKLLFVSNNAYYHYGTNQIYKSDGTSAGTSTLNVPIPNSGTIFLQSMGTNTLQLYNNEIYFPYVKINSSSFPTIVYYDSVYFCKIDLANTTSTIVFRVEGDAGPSAQNLILNQQIQDNSHFIYNYQMTGGGSVTLIFNAATNAVRKYTNYTSGPGYLPTVTIFNNKLYYPFGTTNDFEPAYIDLANDSLFLIKNINPSGSSLQCSNPPNSSAVQYLYQLNGYNYLLAYVPAYGVEFWQTDFTSAGTSLLEDIYVGANDGVVHPVCGSIDGVVTSNNIFFVGDDGVTGNELWTFLNSPNPVGIRTNTGDAANGINLYPNPAGETLNIRSAKDMEQIQLFNTLGALVKETTPANKTEQQLDLASLKAGVYFVTVKTATGSWTGKIIKAE